MGSPQIKGAIPVHWYVAGRCWTLLFKVKLINSVLKLLPAHKNTPVEV